MVVRFLKNDSGAALSEYALIASILAITMMAALSLISLEATTQLTTAQSGLTNAASMNGNSLP